MSAPNADHPNEGIVGSTINSVKNAANYVSETVQGKGKEASAEANKQTVKGHVSLLQHPHSSQAHSLTPMQTDASITDRARAAGSYIGDKADQKKHETSADANKHSI
jgi:Glucose-repressible protein Grg1